MRILFVTLFSEVGGTSRIYVYQFVPFLEKQGIQSAIRTIYTDRFFKVHMGLIRMSRLLKKLNFFFYSGIGILKMIVYAIEARRYDVVYIQKFTCPKSIFWFFRLMNSRVIYGFEDAIYEINPFLKNNAFEDWLLNYQRRLFYNLVRHAAWVMAANTYLATEARKYNANVSVIAEPINTTLFTPGPTHQKSSILMIGWMGSPSTTYLLEGLAPVFLKLSEKNSAIRFKAVGVSLDYSMAGISFVKKTWTLEDQLSDLRSFDVGIMPLDDTPFNRGRLGHKMVQYMSVGIPIVASDIGLNRVAVKDGVNGFLVGTSEEWVEKLLLLASDVELRKKMGMAGRRIVEEEYSLEKKAVELANIIKHVATM